MKFLFDLFPVLLFFIAFKAYDIFVATAVAIAATFVQIGWLRFRRQQVDKMMWANLAVIILFGGATLLFQDEDFIKWKPTVLYWLFATALFVANSFFNKNLIRAMLEKQIELPLTVWNKLNLSWVLFFVFLGSINLYVAYSFSVDTWVSFKLFGSTALMLVFIVVQVFLLNKHMAEVVPVTNDTELEVEETKQVEENVVNKTGEK